MRVFASCTNFRKPGECCIANPPKKSKRSRVAEAEGNTKEQGKRRHTTENTARPLAATKIERRSMTVSGMMFLAKLIRRTVMERFLTRHRDRITGSITGFDRILFRGSLRSICYGEGMDIFLSSQRVLYKDFRTFVQKLSAGIKARAEQLAQQAGRPFLYLSSAQESKEEIARRIQRSSRRADLRAVLRRALPDIRDSPGPGEEGIDVGSAGAQVFAFLLLLPRPGIWVDAHPCV